MASIAADVTGESDPVAAGARPARRRLVWHRLAFWGGHVAFWGVAFAANMLVIAVFQPVPADPPAFVLLEVALCFLATVAMRWFSHREPLLVRLGVTKAGLIAGGAILSAVLVTFVLLAFSPRFGLPFPSRAELLARWSITFAMLATWCAFYFGWQLVRERHSAEIRVLQAEAAALRHELEHLQGQISPHFLFNALNTVKACRDDPEAIATLTQALADYLRFLLRPAATLEPLARELDALEEYLTIQEMRFGDGLESRIDCDSAARGVAVPPVLVQPLVENAIKYGGQTADRPIRVHVAARREGKWLEVEVANTGRWVAPGGRGATGKGLRSLERRLRLLVGPTSTVTHREEDGWVRVLVRVPAPPAGAGGPEAPP